MTKRTVAQKILSSMKGLMGGFTSNLLVDDYTKLPRTGTAPVLDRLGSLLPYAEYGDDGLCAIATPDFGKYEGLGYVIEFTPQTGVSPLMAKSLMQLFGQDTPAGTGIQVSLYGSPFVKPLTDNIPASCAKAKEEDSPKRKRQLELMAELSANRARFLESGSIANPHPSLKSRIRNIRGWVAVSVPVKDPFDPETRAKVLRLAESHIAILTQFHLSSWLWNETVLINTLTQILNPQSFYNRLWYPMHPDKGRAPKDQIVASDTRTAISATGVRFVTEGYEKNTVCALSMSARAYPETLSLNSISHLAGAPDGNGPVFPCPFIVTTLVSVMDFEAGKSKAVMKSARAEQMAATEIAKLIPAMGEEAADWRLAVNAFEIGEGLVQLTHQVLMLPLEEERQNAIEAARGIFRSVGIELAVDDFMHMQGLMATLPMSAGPLLASDIKISKRSTTKTATNASNTLPIIADWRGTLPRAGKAMPTPLLNLTSRRGQIVPVDPFSNPNGNYNGIVVGASGSGKSVLLNEAALGGFRTGGLVRIIDTGRSYEKLCDVVEGQWIEFSDEPRADGSYDCLNPFSLVEDIESDMDLMLPLIAQMASPSKPLNDLELSHLLIHFTDVYETAQSQGRTARISELADSLKNNWRLGGANPSRAAKEKIAQQNLSELQKAEINDPRIADLGVQLAPYCPGGPFATFFEGEANIDFNNHFVVLELERLKTRKALQSVVLMLLMFMIDKEMRLGDRSQTKLVIIDEAWDLLGEGHAGKFIETGYRRARKLNGGFFTATQSPADYWKTETAKAALENSDCIFLLRQKPEVLEQLKRNGQLSIDDAQQQMLRSLTTVAGVYSEVFVRIGDQPPSVNRLMLDPYSQLLMSSHPEDVRAIREKRALGLSTAQALNAVLQDRGLYTQAQ